MIITLRDGLASERACQQRGRTGALYIRGDKNCESVNRGISFFRGLSASEIAELPMSLSCLLSILSYPMQDKLQRYSVLSPIYIHS